MYRYAALFSLLLLSACFMHKKTQKPPDADAAEQPVIKKEAKVRARPVRRPIKPKHLDFQYGSPREEILPQTADRNELMVAEFNKPQGHLVVYQYARFGKAAYKSAKYYLYFMNDTLIRKSGEEDLREGARKAVKEYYEERDEE